ncbi:hypothetical protein ACWECW_11595 [Rhodococcus ruber]
MFEQWDRFPLDHVDRRVVVAGSAEMIDRRTRQALIGEPPGRGPVQLVQPFRVASFEPAA